MLNADVQNPGISGLEDKNTPSLTSDSILWPQRLCFAVPVPEDAGCKSPPLFRAGSGLPALLGRPAASTPRICKPWCTLEQTSGSLPQPGCSRNPESLQKPSSAPTLRTGQEIHIFNAPKR